MSELDVTCNGPGGRPAVGPLARRQMTVEADRIAAALPRQPAHVDVIPADEVVESIPPAEYAAPAWLARVDPGLAAEYGRLMERLRAVNEAWVGETVHRFQGFQAATGEYHGLAADWSNWAGRYAQVRADPGRLSPQYRTPDKLYDSVIREVVELVERPHNRPNSVHPAILGIGHRRAVWRAHWLLMPPADNPLAGRPGADHLTPAGYPAGRQIRARFGWDLRLLADLLRAAGRAYEGCGSPGQNEPDEVLRDSLWQVAAQIQFVRPYLVRNFRPEKSVVRLADDCFVAWRWLVHFGVGLVVLTRSEREMVEALRTGGSDMAAEMAPDGLLLDPTMPWATAADPVPGVAAPLAVSLWILGQVRDQLQEMYAKINHSQVEADAARTRPLAPDTADPSGVPAQAEPPGTAGPAEREVARITRPVRLRVFLRTLVRQFGCEVRTGKGSEVVVSRPGGRPFVLGRHKRNPEVPPETITRCLHRLGIPANGYLAAD